MKNKLLTFFKKYYLEIIFVAIFSFVIGYIFYLLATSINPIIYKDSTLNTWFEADIHRVFENLTDKNSNHKRTSVHPLFSIFTNPFVSILINFFKIWPVAAVRIFSAITSMVWTCMLYILFRIIGLKKLDGFIFTLLGVISSASIFWMTVSETYLLGSISILAALILAALAEQKTINPFWYTVTSLITLSFIITNWMAGLFTTFINNKIKNSLHISMNAWSFAVIIWSIQKYIFPTSKFFLMQQAEKNFIEIVQFNQLLYKFKGFFINSFIMPKIEILEYFNSSNGLRMSVQNSALFSENIYSNISIILWLTLLLIGFWYFFKPQKKKKLRLVIGFILAGQLLLHLFYGREIFLYSLNFLPLLILIASFGITTKNRRYILVLATLLIITASISNFQSFNQAKNFYEPINFVQENKIN